MNSYKEMVKFAEQLENNPADSLKILFLSDYEATQFSKVLKTQLYLQGTPSIITTPEFDTLIQCLLDDELIALHDCIIISLSEQKLREDFYTNGVNAEKKIAQLNSIIKNIKKKIMITNIPDTRDRIFGNSSKLWDASLNYQVQKWNSWLYDYTLRNSNIFLVDFSYIAHYVGLKGWYNDDLWYHAKYLCHPKFFPLLARTITNLIANTQGFTSKCLVLDLDNTLWGGVIGDEGIDGIKLSSHGEGKVFFDFQRYLLQIKESGYLLAICSKNEEETALNAIKNHPYMQIKLDDIATFRINWKNKAENIISIAKELNISTDSIIFLDDTPFERNLVLSQIKQITVPELPENPTQYISFLNENHFFESISYTTEDQNRTRMYKENKIRSGSISNCQNIEGYLKSLQMEISIKDIDKKSIERCAQLIQRSNQFNLRTQRISKAELDIRAKQPKNYKILSVSLRDKFGDLGIIAVVSLEIHPKELFVDEFVMSCRVFKRGVEEFILNYLFTFAKEKQIKQICGEYIKSQKNNLVKNFYENYGFKRTNEKNKLLYFKEVKNHKHLTTYIKDNQ